MVHPGPHPGKDLREPQGALQTFHYGMSKIKLQPPDVVRVIFIFLGGPQAHRNSGQDDKGRGVAKVAWFAGWREPQVPPLRYAPVGMTIL
jgi:hypothetical protein